ncbi:MAG: hypothetical protein Q8P66_02985 [Candidatus Colwellbacteria bacterium]|nr:hypothetical protein [Candidatus Colwellbacteria bacterium]
MNFSRTFPKALLVLVLVLSVFVISVAPVNAYWPWEAGFWDPCGGFTVGPLLCGALDKIAEDIIKGLAGVINGIILFIAGLFFWLANLLIGIALDLNNNLALGKESIVNTGHKIVLGVANMGFIVALAVIAFATMLRWEGFNYKRALPRVIIAALLINFGFFMVTHWLISPVNQITEAFRASSNFDPTNSFAVFKDAAGIGKVAEENIGGVSGIAGEVAKSITSVLFTALFSFLGFLTLMAFAAMLFVRYIALAILIILLPIAWLTWIFPNLKVPGGHPWTVWWENFTRWLLFAPFAMFFFYLAVGLANTKGFIPPADENFSGYLGGAILIIGLLLGGLVVSNKMGVSGGAMALGAVATMKGWAQVQAKQLGRRAGYGAYKGIKGDEAAKRLQTVGAERGRLGKFATGWIRAAGRETTRTAAKTEQSRQEFLKKKFEGLAPFQIADMYEGLNDEEKMAAAQHMVDKGYQWELPEQWTKDVARWEREGSFDKRGRRKLQLDAFDKGYDSKTLAAMEDEEAITAIADPAERVKEAMKRHFSDKDLTRLDDEGLRARTEAAMASHVKILGHKNIPNIDPRILSEESRAFSVKDPVTEERENTDFGNRYRNLFADSVMEHMPTAAAALYGRTRGKGAPFMVEKTEEWIKRWDNEYLVPKAAEIARQEGTRAVEVARREGKTEDEIRKIIPPTEDEIRRRIPGATQKEKIEWVNAVDAKRANRATTQLGAYMQTGKRAWFFPTIGGEAPTAPPA